jgi:hypothetical protein
MKQTYGYTMSGFCDEVYYNMVLLAIVWHLVKLHRYFGTTCLSHHLGFRSMACANTVGEYVLESGGVRGMEFLKDECATIS